MARSDKKRQDKKANKRKQQLRQLAHHPPRLAHETMMGIPGFRQPAEVLIARLRGAGPSPARLMCEDDLAIPEVHSALQGRYALVRQRFGWSHDQGLEEIQQVCSHLFCAVNHELGGKKAFWVSAELAEALSNTNLDIAGDVLKLPFPCCAFVFNDESTIELVRSLVATCTPSRREPFQTLTVYVYASGEGEAQGYDFVFMADGYDGEWPYMLSRSVPTDGKRNLDEILQSHPEGSTDPTFFSDEMRRLLHLVINAVLYTTCDDYRFEVRGPAPPALRGSAPGRRFHLSGDGVFYLPGRITIGEPPGEERRDAAPPSYRIQKRFWVRGHWRRANPSWHDQRLRWIAPHLKGPELTAVIEREYELRGPVRPMGDAAGSSESNS